MLIASLALIVGCDSDTKQQEEKGETRFIDMSVQLSAETKRELPHDSNDFIDDRYIKNAPAAETPVETLPSLNNELPDDYYGETYGAYDDDFYDDSNIILQGDIAPDEPNLYSTEPTTSETINETANENSQLVDEAQLVDEEQVKNALKIRYQYKKQLRPLQKTIAIIIDDIGVDQKRSMKAVQLEGVYTLSFLPYGKQLNRLTQIANDNGHEIFLHQGAEPIGAGDPGPDALLVGMKPEQINLIIEQSLQKLPMVTGINNHMGSKFSQWQDGMNVLLEHTNDKGLIFIDSFTYKSSQGLYLAHAKNYPSLARDVFIDGERNEEWIEKQLNHTLIIAMRDGFAIAIGHPYDITLDILPQWQKQAEMQGFQFVTISQLWTQLHQTDDDVDDADDTANVPTTEPKIRPKIQLTIEPTIERIPTIAPISTTEPKIVPKIESIIVPKIEQTDAE
ncbi:MAG: divergent polysaccharide deacetylase family protein [Alphaproteobacteria bacterium]|nr:divergent polysaccharide deacetylase family protein [Alphaproteobacteria bacterium]